MKASNLLLAQLRSNLPMIGLIFLVSAILIGSVLLLHFWKEIPFGDLTRDPNAINQSPSYIGFLSQTGIFFWSAAAAISLFSASVLSGRPDSSGFREFFLFPAF